MKRLIIFTILLCSAVFSCSAKNSTTVQSNNSDFSIYLTKYAEVPSSEPGYKLIQMQIAFRNNTKDKWVALDGTYSYSSWLISGDGIEYYPGDYRETCENRADRGRWCDEGTAGGGTLLPEYTIVPPGFQVLFREEEWKVGETLDNFTYFIKISDDGSNLSKDKITYSIPLNPSSVETYSTQFIDNMTWEQYKNWGVKESLLLDAGSTVSFEFGDIHFDDHFTYPDETSVELNAEVTNSSPAYELSIYDSWFGTTCIISPNYVYGCSTSFDASANPNQTSAFTIEDGHRIFEIIHDSIEFPVCLIMHNIGSKINNDRNDTEVNLVLCEDKP